MNKAKTINIASPQLPINVILLNKNGGPMTKKSTLSSGKNWLILDNKKTKGTEMVEKIIPQVKTKFNLFFNKDLDTS